MKGKFMHIRWILERGNWIGVDEHKLWLVVISRCIYDMMSLDFVENSWDQAAIVDVSRRSHLPVGLCLTIKDFILDIADSVQVA